MPEAHKLEVLLLRDPLVVLQVVLLLRHDDLGARGSAILAVYARLGHDSIPILRYAPPLAPVAVVFVVVPIRLTIRHRSQALLRHPLVHPLVKPDVVHIRAPILALEHLSGFCLSRPCERKP